MREYINFSLKCPFFHVIQWYIHNFSKPTSPRLFYRLNLTNPIYIWYLLGILRYGILLMGCSLFLILINYKDISYVMIESLHLRKMREKSFFRMPGNTVYNRELPDDLGRVLIRWPIRIEVWLASEKTAKENFDNVEEDAHMIISVILYSMALVLGLLVLVGMVTWVTHGESLTVSGYSNIVPPVYEKFLLIGNKDQ